MNERYSPALDMRGAATKLPNHPWVWSPLSDTYGWDLLFHEARGGVQHDAWLQPGECVREYSQFAPELNQE